MLPHQEWHHIIHLSHLCLVKHLLLLRLVEVPLRLCLMEVPLLLRPVEVPLLLRPVEVPLLLRPMEVPFRLRLVEVLSLLHLVELLFRHYLVEDLLSLHPTRALLFHRSMELLVLHSHITSTGTSGLRNRTSDTPLSQCDSSGVHSLPIDSTWKPTSLDFYSPLSLNPSHPLLNHNSDAESQIPNDYLWRNMRVNVDGSLLFNHEQTGGDLVSFYSNLSLIHPHYPILDCAGS